MLRAVCVVQWPRRCLALIAATLVFVTVSIGLVAYVLAGIEAVLTMNPVFIGTWFIPLVVAWFVRQIWGTPPPGRNMY